MTTLDDNTLDTLNKLTDSTLNRESREVHNAAGITTTLDDPTLNALSDDDLGTIDYDAPERSGSGSYTPQVYPGIHNFMFALEEKDPFEMREYTIRKGKPNEELVKEFTINHKGTVSYTTTEGEQKESTIRFNSAGFHQFSNKHGKKFNSRGAELLRSLGINLGNNNNRPAAEQALREADGRKMGRGVVNWESFCKGTAEAPHDPQTISTSPRKGWVLWPKGTDGRYVESVTCPKCGAALSGREKITDYKLPQG